MAVYKQHRPVYFCCESTEDLVKDLNALGWAEDDIPLGSILEVSGLGVLGIWTNTMGWFPIRDVYKDLGSVFPGLTKKGL